MSGMTSRTIIWVPSLRKNVNLPVTNRNVKFSKKKSYFCSFFVLTWQKLIVEENFIKQISFVKQNLTNDGLAKKC